MSGPRLPPQSRRSRTSSPACPARSPSSSVARAPTATHRPDSDWDLGVYYRGSGDRSTPRTSARLGHPGQVSELGEWGPIVNGGAWLEIDGTPIDVLFRDLDTVERWLREARRGRFEVLSQNGYVVGAPTYSPSASSRSAVRSSASCRARASPTPSRRRRPSAGTDGAAVALMFAEIHARAPDAVCCAGMLVQAVLCAGHARLAARREWVLNEKGLVHRAGLEALSACSPRRVPRATSSPPPSRRSARPSAFHRSRRADPPRRSPTGPWPLRRHAGRARRSGSGPRPAGPRTRRPRAA